MDPQQRLILETSYEALERAGMAPHGPATADAAVFLGASGSDYGRLASRNLEAVGSYFSTGQAFSIVANRVSYVLGMRGPSMVVDTACSSSLVAVHLALRSIRAGECDAALAGGVNIVLAPDMWVSLSEFGMLAADGRCKPFSAKADGYVRSDGCGVVVLKMLDLAVRVPFRAGMVGACWMAVGHPVGATGGSQPARCW